MSRVLPERGYRRNLRAMLPLLLVALAGACLVVASQSSGFVGSGYDSLGQMLPGLGLIVLSLGSCSSAAFVLRWGADFAISLAGTPPPHSEWSRYSLELFGTVFGYAVSNLFVGPANVLIGLVDGSTSGFTLQMAAWALAGGMTIHAFGSIMLRKANLATDNLGVNALSYATPVLALLWLALASQASVARWDYLLAGLAAIVAANCLINAGLFK